MRRILLEVYNFAGSLRILARFLLKIEGLPNIPINAIVDTGSPVTLIGPLDTMRMRLSKIQLQKLEGRNKSINIGGGQVMTKILDGSKLRFTDVLEIEIPVEFPMSGKENPAQPSLLGIDFMLKAKAKLFFDPNKREAYFEVE